MRIVTTILVFHSLVQSHCKELGTNHVAEGQDAVDNLVNRLVDKLVTKFFNHTLEGSTLNHGDLDGTMLATPGNMRLPKASQVAGLPTYRFGKPMAFTRPASRMLSPPISHSVALKTSRAASRVAAQSPNGRGAVVAKAAADELVPDDEFAISKVSFGTILLSVASVLLVAGFGGYFNFYGGEATSGLSGLLLIYGFPGSVLGAALKYAELKPVTCKTTKAAFALRDSQMTDIQKQVREDTTRFRYGDEQHLDLALERIFKIGRPDGIGRSACPRLMAIREETVDGNYAIVLEFENKKSMDPTK
jgi:hypothetical protein